jgi:predicted RNase H-like nuclease (RuvC/YqgF family)
MFEKVWMWLTSDSEIDELREIVRSQEQRLKHLESTCEQTKREIERLAEYVKSRQEAVSRFN